MGWGIAEKQKPIRYAVEETIEREIYREVVNEGCKRTTSRIRRRNKESEEEKEKQRKKKKEAEGDTDNDDRSPVSNHES